MSKYDKAFIKMAYIWADESHCTRRKVGSMIAKASRPISGGYNGTVSGADNCCEEDFGTESDIETRELTREFRSSHEEEAKKFCKDFGLIYIESKLKKEKISVKYRRPQIRTKPSVVHAEANAIAYAAKEGISTKGCTLYVTLSPCINCANLIIQAGIKEVVYAEAYRDLSGVEHLEENGIKVKHFQEK